MLEDSRGRRDEQRRKYSKMDKKAKSKLGQVTQREWRRIGCPKRSSLKNWKDEKKRKIQEKLERGSRKKSSRAGSEKMESWWQIGKMEGHCSTGQSPQWAVVPMEE